MAMFNRTVKYGGSFTSDGAVLRSAGHGIFKLAQQLTLAYQQAIMRLYDLSSDLVYLVGGRTQGQASVQRLLGPSKVAGDFYNRFGDICKAGGNRLDFGLKSNACVNGEDVTYSADICVLDSVNLTTQSQDMFVNEGVGINFSSLDRQAA